MSSILTTHPILARLTWRAFRWAHREWRHYCCARAIHRADGIRNLSPRMYGQCRIYAPTELEWLRMHDKCMAAFWDIRHRAAVARVAHYVEAALVNQRMCEAMR